MTDQPDYEVGYGRPPKSHRFQAGTSGNPAGRPRGARGLKAQVKELLDERVAVTAGGRKKTISTLEAVLKRLKQKAIADGDMRALEKMLGYAAQVEADASRSSPAPLSHDDDAILKAFLRRREERL